tara:strand:- start:197 stop:796 length:600 start_codon:yes stop_codon:yes gene_type:complete
MTNNFLYKFFFNIIGIFFIVIFLSACEKTQKNNVKAEQLIVKVYSSLTCPHCANFHAKVIVSLKNDNSLKDIVKFEHHSFPLEIKALNAEKILHCINNKEKRFELLTNLYKEQRNWASGSNIGDINKALKKIGEKSGLKEEDMNSCLKDDNIQEKILEKLIDAKKRFKISSTPTIFINEKKYEGKHNYKHFKKEIEKFL